MILLLFYITPECFNIASLFLKISLRWISAEKDGKYMHYINWYWQYLRLSDNKLSLFDFAIIIFQILKKLEELTHTSFQQSVDGDEIFIR